MMFQIDHVADCDKQTNQMIQFCDLLSCNQILCYPELRPFIINMQRPLHNDSMKSFSQCHFNPSLFQLHPKMRITLTLE